MGCLKSEIAKEIWMFRRKTLKDAITLARMRDEQLARQKKASRTPFFHRATTNLATTNRSPAANNTKRLTWEEMQWRRALGLCFNCNERFTTGHKCQGSQILMIETKPASEENINNEQVEGQQPEPEITYYALTGWTSPQTMRIAAKIGLYHIMVLVDSGSTHNFISTRMAALL